VKCLGGKNKKKKEVAFLKKDGTPTPARKKLLRVFRRGTFENPVYKVSKVFCGAFFQKSDRLLISLKVLEPGFALGANGAKVAGGETEALA